MLTDGGEITRTGMKTQNLLNQKDKFFSLKRFTQIVIGDIER